MTTLWGLAVKVCPRGCDPREFLGQPFFMVTEPDPVCLNCGAKLTEPSEPGEVGEGQE